MSVSILIVTHRDVGQALLATVKTTFADQLPLPAKAVSVSSDDDPDQLIPMLKKEVEQLDRGDGILLLTDMFGSTPCNIAKALQESAQVHLVAGLNLPMLIRVMNYPDSSLTELAAKAISGGKEGVYDCGAGCEEQD